MPPSARLTMCSKESFSYTTGSLELMPTKPMPLLLQDSAMALIRPTLATT